MEFILFGIPIAIIASCIIAAAIRQRSYRSKFTNPVAVFLDHLAFFSVNVLAGILLYTPVCYWLGLPNEMSVFTAILVTLTFETIAKQIIDFANSKDSVRDFIIALLTKKPPKG